MDDLKRAIYFANKKHRPVSVTARKPASRLLEQQRRFSQLGMSYEEKIKEYPLQPAPIPTLLEMKRRELFSPYNTLWKRKGYVSINTVGPLMSHIKVFPDLTLEEWRDDLFDSMFPYASFYALTERIADETGMDQQLAINLLMTRAVLESYDGFTGERLTFRLADYHFVQNGPYDEVRFANDEEDGSDHIDLVVLKDGRVALALQVKSLKFTLNCNEKHGLTADQISNLNSGFRYEEEHNVKVFYVFKDELDWEMKSLNLHTLEQVGEMCDLAYRAPRVFRAKTDAEKKAEREVKRELERMAA